MHSKRRAVEPFPASPAPAASVAPPRSRLRTFWREWLRPLLALALFLGAFRSAIADWNDVPTGSMKPTVLSGERVFVDRRAYDLRLPFTQVSLWRFGDPARGDIVVLSSPQNGQRLLKRVVGVPGDRIQLTASRLIVNGERARYQNLPAAAAAGYAAPAGVRALLLEESVAGRSHAVALLPGTLAQRDFGPITVPAGEFFVMGDNRDESHDSRAFGFVPRDAMLGRVVAVVASVDPERSYRPRWQRFFRGLE